jgi:two-component system sensor histidine kinase RegB
VGQRYKPSPALEAIYFMKDFTSKNANQKNLLQLLWLRLIAIFGQIVTILFAFYFLKIELPLTQMFGVVFLLLLLVGIGFCRYKFQKNISDKSIFIELLFDIAALTVQLYFSGGISNPFISLFLLQVIISAILLRAIYAWLIAVITTACYVWLNFNYLELEIPHHHEGGDFFNMHLHGMLISFVLAAFLLLIFVTKIIKNLNERDQKIAFLKRQSIEKEQIARMGLFATGAAHELGTPLSTISVIVDDWKKIAEINSKKDLLQDVEIIEEQIERCKKILSQILSSSGNQRLEEARAVEIKKVFDDLVRSWSDLRKPKNLIYNFFGESQQKIILDETLTQAFFNVFDNALEASPMWIKIEVKILEKELFLEISDRGKGFSNKILQEIGKINLSTKSSSGLGLFLAINSLKNFGGELKIQNLKKFGAKVEIKIPLKNL